MALSLLQGYDSDQASSSDSEDDLQVTIDKEALASKTKRPRTQNTPLEPSQKRIKTSRPARVKPAVVNSQDKKDIPLPPSINAMFIEVEEEVVHDDPTLHEGRIRTFSHEKNNWATYVYVNLQDCELGKDQPCCE